MIIKQFITGPIDNNNYLIADEKSKEAALIDCSEYSQEIIDFIKQSGLEVKYILLTHGHFDHILGITKMKEQLDAKIAVHEQDTVLLKNINEYMKLFNAPSVDVPTYDLTVEDGDIINLGDIKIKVIHTPGHTKGSVCYLVEDKLFSGDTLFRESIGRTDLPGGSFDEIKNSVKTVLFSLDEKITAYPGHGPETTIKHEKLHNEIINF